MVRDNRVRTRLMSPDIGESILVDKNFGVFGRLSSSTTKILPGHTVHLSCAICQSGDHITGHVFGDTHGITNGWACFGVPIYAYMPILYSHLFLGKTI